MNRLNLWIDRKELIKYINSFKKNYSQYVYKSTMHEDDRLFFAVPMDNIERVYFPRKGLSELMSMPKKDLDEHLDTVFDFIQFLLKSELEVKDLGITYSTLMGHYFPNMSDINVVVYGKDKFWKLMEYLKSAHHKNLRWKTYEEWDKFYKKRERHVIQNKEKYIENMYRKKSEGLFNKTLFVIFAVEEEDEVWFRWDSEKYKQIGFAKISGTVVDNKSSVVRPGYYELNDTKIISSDNNIENLSIKRVVFYSRDYCMFAYPNEKIEVSGLVEEVTPKSGEKYHRIVVGYFDAYISERRDKEYIKLIDD